MDDNINVLNEIHEGLVIGINSLSTISSDVADNDFRKVLNSQYDEYNTFLNKVNYEFSKRGENPKEVSTGMKIMTYMNNKMNTMTDRSTSNISKLLIRGTSMGIITGRKLLNEELNISFEVRNLLEDFVSKQENDVEVLKEWL